MLRSAGREGGRERGWGKMDSPSVNRGGRSQEGRERGEGLKTHIFMDEKRKRNCRLPRLAGLGMGG